MLSWFAKKLYWSKRRSSQRKQDGIQLSKWHKACLWLAHSVGGVDMLLRDDGTVVVISRSSCDPESLDDGVISKSKHGSIRSHLRVSMLVDEESRKFKFKTVDAWSESLAKFIATLIALMPVDPHLDPPEHWGVMIFNPVSSDGLALKSEVRFPTFKSEEELFMRMALDGIVLDEKDV